MQLFGIVGLLVTLTLGVWLVGSGAITTSQPRDANTTDRYTEAIDSARSAAESLGSTPTGERIEVYAGVTAPKDAQELDLSGKELTGSLKAEIRQLSRLEVLDISNNNFTGLPAEVGQLTELRILNLSNNSLTGLPRELGNLNKLQVLDVRDTNYSEVDLEAIVAQLPGDVAVLR